MKQNSFFLLVCLCVLASILSELSAQAAEQTNTYSFERFTTQDGLFSDEILSMEQDHQGYLWVGAVGGLYRYDGYEFYQFSDKPNTSNSLNARSIPFIYEDTQLNFWVCSGNEGLRLLDRNTGQFTHFLSDPENPESLSSNGVLRVLEDRRGDFWVGTLRGLDLLDRETGKFTRFAHDVDQSNKKEPFHIISLEESKDTTIWVGTISWGLFNFDPKTKVFTPFPLPFTDEIGQADVRVRIRCTYEDEQGDLWVGTTAGLYRVNRETGEIKTYRKEEGNPASLAASSVMDIKVDLEGNLWIATQSGLSQYLPASDSFVSFFNDAEDPNSPSNDYIDNLLIDDQGDIWLGTGGGGINRLHRKEEIFTLYSNNHKFPSGDQLKSLRSFQLDAKGYLWFGGINGQLSKLDPWQKDLTSFQLPFPETGLAFANEINSLLIDEQGVIWIGTRASGLFQYDPITEQMDRFNSRFPDDWGLKEATVKKMFEDKEGQIWFSFVNHGLIRFSPKTGQLTRFIADNKNPSSIFLSTPLDVTEDREGNLWIIVNVNGIDRFDPKTQKFHHYHSNVNDPNSLISNQVTCIVEDKKGRIWIGTQKGLNLYQPSTNNFKEIRTDKGENLGEIGTIVEDEQQKLWIGTDRGMYRFDPVTKAIRQFDHNDGLKYQNYLWNQGAIHPKTKEAFFVTQGGFLTFYPDSITDSSFSSPVSLTKATYYNVDEPTIPIEDIWIGNKTEITLPHEVNIMEFDLALLNFHQTSKNQYAYQLESKTNWSIFSESSPWFELGNDNHLRFTNLPDGKHTLRVKGANNHGVWNNESTTLIINKTAPWWRTGWAYIVYLLGSFGAVFILSRLELNRRNHRQQAQIAKARAEEKQQQAEKIAKQATRLSQTVEELQEKNSQILVAQNQLIQQEKMASLGQLTAGIAHEIKNPLNFVNNFAEGSLEILNELVGELKKEGGALSEYQSELVFGLIQELEQNAVDIHENGLRADRIIHSMMDHARGSETEEQVVDLNGLVEDNINLAYHGYRALDASFNTQINKEFSPRVGEQTVYPQALGRVLLNLLNNACHAVREKQKMGDVGYHPMVSITTKRSSEAIEILVRDNGIGIPNDVVDKIFNPFFTTKETGHGNTGLGLSISYDIIVKQHGGEITVLSEPGHFTAFIIKLPATAEEREENLG